MDKGMSLLSAILVTALWVPLIAAPACLVWLLALWAHLEYLCHAIVVLSIAVWATTLLYLIDSQRATAKLMLGSLSAWLLTAGATYIFLAK